MPVETPDKKIRWSSKLRQDFSCAKQYGQNTQTWTESRKIENTYQYENMYKGFGRQNAKQKTTKKKKKTGQAHVQ